MAGDSTESPHEHVPSAARLFDASETSESECEWHDVFSGFGSVWAWVGQAQAETDAANSENAAISITKPRILRTKPITILNDRTLMRPAATL